LLTHDLIGLDRGEELVRGFRAFDPKVDRHTFRFRTDNQVIIWEAVRAGIGIGIAQNPLVKREPLIRALMPDLPLPVMPMWLTMHKDVRTNPRIRRTADFLYEALSAFARSAATV
jgi:DNA-binding transcriptional LysR family regulator